MGLKFKDVMGKKVLDVIQKSRLMEALESGKPIWGNPIFNKDGHEMFSNYVPVYKNGKLVAGFIQIIFGNIEDAIIFSETVSHVKNELDYYKKELRSLQTSKYSIDSIVGESKAIAIMKQRIISAANSLSTVLIVGETGSGKELVAHAIHNLSQRREHPFIKINCATIPPELAESELFGYEYGAFTGAKKGGKEGLFEMANKGSIFLDEINQMSYFIQPKILRTLQEREVGRVGGKTNIPIDVRVIAATNQPLEQLIEENKFRRDLFYRLNVVRIGVPPLREHLEDIPLLVDNIVKRLNFQLGIRVEGITEEAIKQLQSYDWPGNIRELQNVLEQAMNMKYSGILDGDCFEPYFSGKSFRNIMESLGEGKLDRKKKELERFLITESYTKFKKNKKKTAEHLGISRPMLYQRLKEYGLVE